MPDVFLSLLVDHCPVFGRRRGRRLAESSDVARLSESIASHTTPLVGDDQREISNFSPFLGFPCPASLSLRSNPNRCIAKIWNNPTPMRWIRDWMNENFCGYGYKRPLAHRFRFVLAASVLLWILTGCALLGFYQLVVLLLSL